MAAARVLRKRAQASAGKHGCARLILQGRSSGRAVTIVSPWKAPRQRNCRRLPPCGAINRRPSFSPPGPRAWPRVSCSPTPASWRTWKPRCGPCVWTKGTTSSRSLPLHHTYATTCTFLAPLEAGCSVTFVEKIVPTVVIRHIEESGVTVLIGVPLLVRQDTRGDRGRARQASDCRGPGDPGIDRHGAFPFRRLRLDCGPALLGFLRRKAGLDSLRLCVSGGGPLLAATRPTSSTPWA